ncbi:glycosyltransferase family 39 protein [Flavobacterium polysaccharolyticum]|uniref:Glycosyltransferase family 39 protein n=1 Tax=Flavobacterium polysaccharolyticum TaxID=3133148 RepID=A0ABU9NN18_9FLAO
MKKKTLLLLGFVILKFILQYFLISSAYDLHRDEYLHIDQGQHLAWGYQSVPPLTSWISYLIYELGNGVFWVKFFPALFGALTMVVVWKAIEALHGNIFALVLGATCVLFSVLLRLNLLFQPNSFDVLCWTTLYFLIIQYFQTESPKWLYMSAVVFALGFLNKYTIVFLLLGLIPAILCTEQRKIFTQKAFYFSILLGVLLIAPNLYWQIQNDFPVIWHIKELSDTQLVNVDRMDFFKAQITYFIGSFIVLLAAIYALVFYTPYRKLKAFSLAIVLTLLVLAYFKAKGYYAIGLYPIYIAFGAVFLSNTLHQKWKNYWQPALMVLPLLFFILMYQVVFPNKSPEYILNHQEKYQKLGLLRWEDGKDHPLPQDFADMLGWKELASKVDSVYTTLPNKEKTLILCDNYGQAGAINFYTQHQLKAVSFNADYIHWFDLNKKYENLIRIKEAQEVADELKQTAPFFESSMIAAAIENKYARELGTTIFRFEGSKIDINKRIKDEIEEVKQ